MTNHPQSAARQFRDRLLAGDPLIGTFLKTPSPIAAEVLCQTSLDVFTIDVEHAPFGRLELDLCIAAFRATNKPCIVRVGSDSPHDIRNALDSGAAGLLVPHVTNAGQARAIVRSAHFGDGGRGFAGSPRAADYTGKKMAEHLADSKAETTVIVQIEDLPALDDVAGIASAGVDAVFIGRIDLAVAMGKSPMDKSVIDAVRRVCEEARAAGAIVGMYTPDLDEIPGWIDAGCSLYLLSSEQSMIIAGGNQLAKDFRRRAET